jgi:hypothetical protein
MAGITTYLDGTISIEPPIPRESLTGSIWLPEGENPRTRRGGSQPCIALAFDETGGRAVQVTSRWDEDDYETLGPDLQQLVDEFPEHAFRGHFYGQEDTDDEWRVYVDPLMRTVVTDSPLVIWPVMPAGAMTTHEAAQRAQHDGANLAARFSRADLECLLSTLAELYDGRGQEDLSERQQTLSDRLRSYWLDAQVEPNVRPPAHTPGAFPRPGGVAAAPVDNAAASPAPPARRSALRRALP